MGKKVAIVSCYFKKNYGSQLQAYATQKILDELNIENETIDISQNIDFAKGKKKYYMNQITNFNFIKTKLGMIKLKFYKKFNKELGKNISIRDKKFTEFENKFKLSKKYNTYEELKKQCENYSSVIVGSDQLWLPVNVVADYYTLNWVPDNVNKISYATSFGFSNVPEKYKSSYTKFLNRIDYLSTREKSGVNIIKELTNRDAKLVCDPTLLLTKEQWMEIQKGERLIDDKYIFCYFLGDNIEHRKFVEKLKEKTGYKIVSLNHCDEYVKYSDKFADITPYDVGPEEFINYIRNAEYVCTDSFHGTVFSLINNTKFFTFERFNKKTKMSTNSRIHSLLEIVKMKKRLFTGMENIEEIPDDIDFSESNIIINELRQESMNWLLKSIKYKDEDINKKFIQIDNKEMCCGCTACASICPQNAIEMISDMEGFLYPKVNKGKCTNCGLCKKTCPILEKQKLHDFEQKAYIFQNKNDSKRADSTSGGVYSAIAEYVIDNNGVVFGAILDEDFIVKHVSAMTKKDIIKFRKSKYVQSNLNNTFREAKKNLDEGKMVCYSGTPCQIAGLKNFLKKDYDNLILIDIMCHSVPSPLYFEKYKKYILNKMKANKILDINFRDKSKYGYKYSMMTVVTDNGTYSQGIDTDPFLRAFFKDYSVRPSCYNCKFKTQRRVSDITIWDCFNINEISKDFDDDKGTTRILIQSENGLNILKKLEKEKNKEIPVDVAISKVKEMNNSVKYNPRREEFFNNIENEDLIDKYFPITIKTKINSFIRKFLSITGLYSNVKSIAKRILRK